MGRPKKSNADYFSHDADMRNDRRLKALRQKFGIKSYAVYCMLLEILTDSDHIQLTLNEMEMELISGDMGIDSQELSDIIANMETLNLVQIDQDKMLRCKKLDERLSGVFVKRTTSLDSLRNGNPPLPVLSVTETQFMGVSAPESTQSKVKESKEEKKGKQLPLSNDLEIVKDILEKLGKSVEPKKIFSIDNPAYQYDLKARIREGHVTRDFEMVISLKVGEWRESAEMSKNLVPKTLFGKLFKGYLDIAKPRYKRIWSDSGDPMPKPWANGF